MNAQTTTMTREQAAQAAADKFLALNSGNLAAYLESWLSRDPAARYARHPMLVRTTFSLVLEDEFRDAARAFGSMARSYVRANRDARLLRSASDASGADARRTAM